MKSDRILSRRNFVASTSAGAGAILMAFPGSGSGAASQSQTARPGTSQTPGAGTQGQRTQTTQSMQTGPGNPPTPVENLATQHGAVGRLLLVYQDAAKQLQAGRQVDVKPINDATQIIQTAVVQLHAPLEEQYVYPRVEQSAQYAETVKTLREQHAAIRNINSMLMEMTKGGNLSDPKQAAQTMNEFCRMVAAHVAWEHSEIFPAFRAMLPADQYVQLGRQFQQKEQSALGGQTFAQLLTRIEAIEANFGLKNLAQYTAQVQRIPIATGESAKKPVATEQ